MLNVKPSVVGLGGVLPKKKRLFNYLNESVYTKISNRKLLLLMDKIKELLNIKS